jgi:outer membrane lipoprotein-sorting protein
VKLPNVALLCLSLSVGSTASAQGIPLSDLMRDLAAVSASQGRFTETRKAAMLTAPLVLKGTLAYRRPLYLERHVQSPYEERTIIEGSLVTIEDARGKRTVQVPPGPLRALLESTRATLAGDLASLQRHYSIQVSGSRDAWRLRLEPSDPALAAMVERIVFEGAGARVLRIEILEPTGDSTTTVIVDDR